jgi:hypothetical protein
MLGDKVRERSLQGRVPWGVVKILGSAPIVHDAPGTVGDPRSGASDLRLREGDLNAGHGGRERPREVIVVRSAPGAHIVGELPRPIGQCGEDECPRNVLVVDVIVALAVSKTTDSHRLTCEGRVEHSVGACGGRATLERTKRGGEANRQEFKAELASIVESQMLGVLSIPIRGLASSTQLIAVTTGGIAT